MVIKIRFPCLNLAEMTEYVAAQSRIDEAALLAMQQQMVQQAAFSQIPDVVKRVSNSSKVYAT